MKHELVKPSARATRIVDLHNGIKARWKNGGPSPLPRPRGARYAVLTVMNIIDEAGLHHREEDAVAFLDSYCKNMRKHIDRIEKAIR